LTVRDAFSRYILAVEVLEGTTGAPVRKVFDALFRKHGLPVAIQCDNGTPFISTSSRGGLTQLSAWWVSLGIKIVRSRPAHPQDNGGHERMHRDMAADLEAFPQATRQEQQRACSKWRQEFNHVRPHEALGGKVPAEVYKSSVRRSQTPPRQAYPSHWVVRRVTPGHGTVRVEGQSYMVSAALGGHCVALEPVGGLRHRIWFHDLDLGLLELAPPTRMIDSVVDAFLERPFGKTNRRKRFGSDSSAGLGPSASPSTPHSQVASLPPRPPQLPLDTCSQQTLGSSAVSSAAIEVHST
jgi:hypothetical protein